MTIHPRHPPSPDVAKMTDFGRGCFCCVELASDVEVAMMNGLLLDACLDSVDGCRLCASDSLALCILEYKLNMVVCLWLENYEPMANKESRVCVDKASVVMTRRRSG